MGLSNIRSGSGSSSSAYSGTRHKLFTRTSGDLVLNSTVWANLPTIGTTWDIVLPAVAGDDIECGVSGWVGATNVAYVCLDVASIVAAAPVNYWGASGNNADYGVQAWLGANNLDHSKTGSIIRTLLGGDVSVGNVTLRLRFRTSAALNKTLAANALQPLQFWAKNIGPPV